MAMNMTASATPTAQLSSATAKPGGNQNRAQVERVAHMCRKVRSWSAPDSFSRSRMRRLAAKAPGPPAPGSRQWPPAGLPPPKLKDVKRRGGEPERNADAAGNALPLADPVAHRAASRGRPASPSDIYFFHRLQHVTRRDGQQARLRCVAARVVAQAQGAAQYAEIGCHRGRCGPGR